MRTQARLLAKYLNEAQPGEICWIGVRPERKAAMRSLTDVELVAGAGLKGDHKALKSNGSARQVTLINAEDIAAVSQLLGLAAIDPAILRRNLVVKGMNLHAMRYGQLRVGSATLELGAHCHPCVRMEQALGKGAVLALYGHAGYCAKVIESGVARVGDSISLI